MVDCGSMHVTARMALKSSAETDNCHLRESGVVAGCAMKYSSDWAVALLLPPIVSKLAILMCIRCKPMFSHFLQIIERFVDFGLYFERIIFCLLVILDYLKQLCVVCRFIHELNLATQCHLNKHKNPVQMWKLTQPASISDDVGVEVRGSKLPIERMTRNYSPGHLRPRFGNPAVGKVLRGGVIITGFRGCLLEQLFF